MKLFAKFFIMAGLAAFALPTFAQPAPRTTGGRPDFQGVWSSKGLTPLERLPGATGLVVGEEEAAKLVSVIRDRARSKAFEVQIDPNLLAVDVRTLTRVDGQWRSSWITDPPDGKLPLTAEGQRILAVERSRLDGTSMLTDPETRLVYERCLAGPGVAPLWSVPVENMRRIVQTPGHVVLYTEEGGDARIVAIGAAHRPGVITSWLGDSVGRWEGDTLVVETVSGRDNSVPFPTMPQVVRRQSRVIERFSFVSADEILYRFTVEDPEVYDKPWSAEYSLNREKTTAYEYGCHEGNYSLPNILRAARIADGRKADAPTR
ncbi:MAG: hypothetical protein SGJ21_08660 [Alphaproteobacteria bacterium]|nr:hypothetical protein [Alphaproteobacteria bacterium]